MYKAIDVATLLEDGIIEDDALPDFLAQTHIFRFDVNICLAQLFHELCIREAFADDGVV